MNKRYCSALFLLLLLICTLPSWAQLPLVVLQTSDVHSRIEPIDAHSDDRNAGMGGFVRRAALIKQVRSTNANVLLFDCGDFSQGTPYYNLYKGEVEIKLMNEMGYSAVTIGNHEFDFGLDNMARLFRLAKFPVVCSNYDVKGTVLEGLVKPYHVFKVGDAKVGVFGLSPKLDGLVQQNKCMGIVYEDPFATAQKMTDLLRNKEKCDVVICLSHLGIDDDKIMIKQTRHIDVILGGHSHTFMRKPAFFTAQDGKKVLLSHTGKEGIFVGEIQLTLTR